MWWLASIIMFLSFGVGILLLTDIALFIRYGGEFTLSKKIRQYIGANEHSVFWPTLIGFIAGFIIGGLFVHFTGWYV